MFGFTPASVLGQLIFGSIGLYGFNHGRGEAAWKPLFLGLALMLYPYLVPDTLLLYLIGAGLTAGLYFAWE